MFVMHRYSVHRAQQLHHCSPPPDCKETTPPLLQKIQIFPRRVSFSVEISDFPTGRFCRNIFFMRVWVWGCQIGRRSENSERSCCVNSDEVKQWTSLPFAICRRRAQKSNDIDDCFFARDGHAPIYGGILEFIVLKIFLFFFMCASKMRRCGLTVS